MDFRTQKQTYCTVSGDIKRTVLTNRYGEEIKFKPSYPPRGFVFLASGNAFLTRRCRELAQKLYAVYRRETRRRPAQHIGIYVPKDVLERARCDFRAERAKVDEKLWQTIDKSYPLIPGADRKALHHLILSKSRKTIKTRSKSCVREGAHDYVRNQYTEWKSLQISKDGDHGEAFAQIRRKIEEILISWGKENESEETNKSIESRKGSVLGEKGSKF
jgi:hypothetical protein